MDNLIFHRSEQGAALTLQGFFSGKVNQKLQIYVGFYRTFCLRIPSESFDIICQISHCLLAIISLLENDNYKYFP